MTAKDDWYDPHGVQDHASAEAYIAELEAELRQRTLPTESIALKNWLFMLKTIQWEGVKDMLGSANADNQRLRDALEEAEALLDAAVCPSCDKSGAYYDSMGDIHQCQWCYEVKALKDRSE